MRSSEGLDVAADHIDLLGADHEVEGDRHSSGSHASSPLRVRPSRPRSMPVQRSSTTAP
jgi:hypothetical protein